MAFLAKAKNDVANTQTDKQTKTRGEILYRLLHCEHCDGFSFCVIETPIQGRSVFMSQ